MNNRSVKLKVLTTLAIFACVVWFVFSTILKSPFSGELRHDFGVVPIDRPFSVLEHTFRLTNTTDHTMQLANATPTCGCTTTEWPDDPVPIGEELIIPTHLTLRRSQLKSSKIRLEFVSGETVVLHIKGVGRFTQPLSFVQQAMKLTLGDEEGFRGVLKLEWYDKSKPPDPTIETPNGIRVQLGQWRMAKVADTNKMTPQLWTIVLTAYQTDVLEDDASITVKIEGVTELDIPCTANTLNPPPLTIE